MRYVLTVDPGVNTLGWCAWERREWEAIRDDHSRSLSLPRYAGNIAFSRSRVTGMEWHRQLGELMADFQIELGYAIGKLDNVVEAYVEEPIVFAGSVRGVAAKDDVVHVAFAAGYVMGMFKHASVWPVPVTAWKGQMRKATTQRRIRRKFMESGIKAIEIDRRLPSGDGHAWDACGIGLFALGRF